MLSITITQVSRFLTFLLFFLCFIQTGTHSRLLLSFGIANRLFLATVSSTPVDQSAPVVAVSNKNAEIAVVSALYLSSTPSQANTSLTWTGECCADILEHADTTNCGHHRRNWRIGCLARLNGVSD
jgi:hypothetical protein